MGKYNCRLPILLGVTALSGGYTGGRTLVSTI
jgi:hypothetical protein